VKLKTESLKPVSLKPVVPKTLAWKEQLIESLKDPEAAAHYLTACLEDGNPEVFLLALRDVAEARGGMRALATSAQLNRESLYRMLSPAGNPTLTSLTPLLNSLGLRLAIEAK
jgi:probable addiction module antidote protein